MKKVNIENNIANKIQIINETKTYINNYYSEMKNMKQKHND